MPSFNNVVLIGRLTNDPDLRYTASGLATVRFSLAVDRPFKDPSTGERKTDFFRCVGWKQKAEFVSQYVPKGCLVCVSGRIEINQVPQGDGNTKFYTDIVANHVEKLQSTQLAGGDESEDDIPEATESDPPASAQAAQRQPQTRPQNRPAAPGSNAARPRATAPAQPGYHDDYDDSDPFADH